jgi:hypothetical protein
LSTNLQKDLAEAIVKNQSLPINKRKNKKDLLVSTGYSQITAESIPSRIIESKGVKNALREFGLTEELITTALVEDIKSKKGKRERELALGADILKMRDKEEGNSRQINIVIPIQVAQSFNINQNIENDGTNTETSGSNPE